MGDDDLLRLMRFIWLQCYFGIPSSARAQEVKNPPLAFLLYPGGFLSGS